MNSTNLNYQRLTLINRTFYESNGFLWGRVLLVLVILGIVTSRNMWFFLIDIHYISLILFLIVGLDTSRFVANDFSKEEFDLVRLTLLDAQMLVKGYQKTILARNLLVLGINQYWKWIVAFFTVAILSLSYFYQLHKFNSSVNLDVSNSLWLNWRLGWTLSWFVVMSSSILWYRVFRQSGILTGMFFRKTIYVVPVTFLLGILTYGLQMALRQGLFYIFPFNWSDSSIAFHLYSGYMLSIVYPLAIHRLLYIVSTYIWEKR